jgi:potassium efflux system protein
MFKYILIFIIGVASIYGDVAAPLGMNSLVSLPKSDKKTANNPRSPVNLVDQFNKMSTFNERIGGEIKDYSKKISKFIPTELSEQNLKADSTSLELSLENYTKTLQATMEELQKIRKEQMELRQRRKMLPKQLQKKQTELNLLQGKILLTEQETIEANVLTQQIKLLDLEIQTFEKHNQVLRLKHQYNQLVKNDLEKATVWLKSALNNQRYKNKDNFQSGQNPSQSSGFDHPVLRKLNQKINKLGLLLNGADGISQKLVICKEQTNDYALQKGKIRLQYEQIKGKIDAIGMTDVIGLLFQKYKSQLPSKSNLLRKSYTIQTELANTQLLLIEYEELLGSLRLQSIDKQVPKFDSIFNQDIKRAFIKEFERLQMIYLNQVSLLVNELDMYFLNLADQDAMITELISEVKVFQRFIDENILWTRSNIPWNFSHIPKLVKAWKWLFSWQNWSHTFKAFWSGCINHKWYALILILITVLHFVFRGRFFEFLKIQAELASNSNTGMMITLESLGLTLLMASLWPLNLFLISGLIKGATEVSSFAEGVASGLEYLLIYLFVFEFIRILLSEHGLGENHFFWSETAMKTMRFHHFKLGLVVLPCVFLFANLYMNPVDAVTEALERPLFSVCLLSFSFYIYKVFHPSNEWLAKIFKENPKGWLKRLNGVWFPLGWMLPLVFAGVSLTGYHYLAFTMVLRLQKTFVFIFLLILVRSLINRWFYLVRNGHAYKNDGKRNKSGVRILLKIHEASQKLVDGLTLILVIYGFYTIWFDIFPAIGVLNHFVIWEHGPNEYITGQDFAVSLIILVLTWIAATNLPGLIEYSLLQRFQLTKAQCYAFVTLMKYCLVVAGIAIAGTNMGIGWDRIQWLAAAFTVGLGFGLQEIFANFIAGLILLFEQPIRKGDTVTIGDISGTVSHINIRATTITDFNRKDLIVPNKDFITQRLVNWTLSDSILRLDLPVGVSYSSDVNFVREVILNECVKHPKVLKSPEPFVVMREFGSSSLDFELRAFIDDVNNFMNIRDQLMRALFIRFREEGIQIPFPQRDLHIKSGTMDKLVPNGE